MIFSVVRDIRGFDGRRILAALDAHRRRMKFELVSIERYGFHGLLDVDLDVALALVAPWFAGLEFEEGDGVVGRLDTALMLAIWLLII